MHSSTLLSVFGLVASASAHMKMSEPKGWFVNNSPLDPSGSDFPCKAVDYNAVSEVNVYQQGQSAPLTFIGQAVHGGGSCQVSLTTDLNPTKDSVWRVIKSIEGGCPAQGEEGNMGENAEAEDPYKYEFVIPDDVPAGNYTIAWTWFNKIGNREMYMNCGPATVVGDGGSDSFFNSLPEMFQANIGNGCETEHGTDLLFPNPGQNVEKLNGATDVFKAPKGTCQTAAAGGSGGDYAPTDAPAPTPTPTAGSGSGNNGGGYGGPGKTELPGGVFAPVETPVAQPTETPANNGGSVTTAPVPTEAAQLPDPATPVETPAYDSKPEVEEPAADEPAETPADSNSGSTGGGSAFPAGTACSEEGYWNCVGGSSFQRCASGFWSSPISLAAGVSCSGDMSETISLSKRGRPIKATRFGAKMRI